MPTKISRSYACVNGRYVHYRYCGSGPALVLLHASPVSSQVFESDYIPVFSNYFTCIAPDTPGNAYSETLADMPSFKAEDYAIGLAQFLDAINVKHCVVYGRHTGASIAMAFANLFPERTRFIYCDGYPAFKPNEVQAYIGDYLAPVIPDSAGGFLIALWFRYRDQHVFWPWHRQLSANRSDADVPSLDFIQRGVVDLLLSRNSFIEPYTMSLKDGAKPLRVGAQTSVCFAIRPGDSLYKVQERLVNLPAKAWREELARGTPEAVTQELKILLENSKDLSDAAPVVTKPIESSIDKGFISVGNGQIMLRVKKAKKATQPPLIMLPHLPGGGSYLELLQHDLSDERDTVLIDIPAHGDSNVDTSHTIEAYADHIVEMMAALELSGVDLSIYDLYGHRGGALVALELSRRRGARRLILDNPILLRHSARSDLVAHYQFDLSLSWDGSHLVRLWHHLRDQDLWFPWDSRSRACARHDDWRFDVSQHYGVFVDCLKQLSNYQPGWAAVLGYHCEMTLAQLNWSNIRVLAAPHNPYTDDTLIATKTIPESSAGYVVKDVLRALKD